MCHLFNGLTTINIHLFIYLFIFLLIFRFGQRCEASCPAPPADPRRQPAGAEAAGAVQQPNAEDCKTKIRNSRIFLYTRLSPEKKISQLCVFSGCNRGHHINKFVQFFFLFQNFQQKSFMAIYTYIFQRAWPVCSSA